MCPLPRSVKFLGIVAFVLFIGAQYCVYNAIFSQIVNLLKIPSDFISTINVVTINGIVISHLFAWAIFSTLTYCSFRMFKFNITYSTTFLIVGHIYFILTPYPVCSFVRFGTCTGKGIGLDIPDIRVDVLHI